MKFTKTLAAITAAAMAVTMVAIPASAVEKEVSVTRTAEFTADEWGTFALPQVQSTNIDGAFDFAETDTLTVTVAPTTEEDTSTWQISFMGQNTDWGSNWVGLQSEAGQLTHSATIGDILKNNEMTLDVLAQIIVKVENCGAKQGDVKELEYTITVSPAAATPDDDDTTNDDTTNDDNTVGDTEPAPGDTTAPQEPAAPTDVELDNAGTTTMDGGWRVNLVHPWAGEENKEAFNIVDATKFANSNTISVKFKVTNVTDPFTAWLAFATNDDTGLAYWGADNEANSGVTQTPITIDKDGYYVLTLTTDKLITVGENFFLALQTDNKDEESTLAIELVAVKAGEALEVTDDDVIGDSTDPINPDTGVTLVVVPAALAAAALATSGIVLKKRSK